MNFFEDFSVGKRFTHATPRTLTEGDAALYIAHAVTDLREAALIPAAVQPGLAGAAGQPLARAAANTACGSSVVIA